MNERHRIYFRNKLVAWKEEIVRQNRETLHMLHENSPSTPISPIGPRPRPTARWNCGPATASAS